MVAEIELTTATDRRARVTFVRAVVENCDARRRVRLVDTGEGPVWPPRRHGVPAAGWDETGVELVLDAGERRALGYATPAPADDPPLTVAETTHDPAPADTGGAAVVRELGDPSPPRDAVPVPTAAEQAGRDRTSGGQPASEWGLEAVARVRRAEALAAAESLPAATRSLADVGDLRAVRELRERLAADERRLRHRAARARELAARAERVEIPLERLERLA